MPLLKNKLVIGAVGVAAVAAALFLGIEVDWAQAVEPILSGDVSILCENVEAANTAE